MKKCSCCGTEYTDSVSKCALDGEPLSRGSEAQSEGVGASSTLASPPPADESAVTSRPAGDSPLAGPSPRLVEVALVCAVAFGGSLLASTFRFFGYSFGSSGDLLKWANFGLHESTALALLWYVLKRTGRSFQAIGLTWEKRDLVRSIGLWFGGSFIDYAIFGLIHASGLSRTSQDAAVTRVGVDLFPAGVTLAAFSFQFLNPFFEELIARAYVMTEVCYLTGTVWKAVLVSALLQTSYHFYQGAPLALSAGGMFLFFSIYYARTRRITPLILAHLYCDLSGTLWFLLK